MDKKSSIVVTGAAGFIGSCLVGFLNQYGFQNIIIVDDFTRVDKEPNFAGKQFAHKVEREVFFDWLSQSQPTIDFVFHIGARTDTQNLTTAYISI